jgi:5-formyltetrahydrofolate cyclo-ligase
VRKLALERGITVITPTPRLKGAFRKFDPRKIPKDRYDEAATLKRGGAWGEDLALEALPKVDLVVMGSVAVTRAGKRLGKGHGYADLEYAMLRELGNAAVPVATTVHALQVLGGFPTESHDLALSLIATPEELIEVQKPAAPPSGVDWHLLPAAALEEMPVLGELRRLLASKSAAARPRKGRPSTRTRRGRAAHKARRKRG